MSRLMDGTNKMQGDAGAYIWLRYETQFEKDGRKHTLEMSVPVPSGASAEEREQLFREAEEGLQQLAAHVNASTFQLPQRVQTTSGPVGRIAAPRPAASTKPTPAQQTTTQRTNPPSNRPASLSAPHTSTQPSDSEQATAERMRPGVVLPAGEPGSSMPLPQFIQYIKDNLGLTPKQAMEILNVRSLTTGINLRDALDQLKARVGQGGSLTSGTQPTRQNSGPLEAPEHHSEEHSRNLLSGTLPPVPHNEQHEQRPANFTHSNIEMRVPSPASGFDEELDLEDLEDPGEPNDPNFDFDKLEDLDMPGDQFSPAEIEFARGKIEDLRSIQGATTVNVARLQSLSNVISHQISQEQLEGLISGIWNITNSKKLKVDQVEALISWAKWEDNFVGQVEAILKVLSES